MTEKNSPTIYGEATTTSIISSLPSDFKGEKSYLDLTPIRAIRAFCLDCEDGASGVKACTRDGFHSFLCPLYHFRLGHNPSIERKPLSDEQKAQRIEALMKARNARFSDSPLMISEGLSSDGDVTLEEGCRD